MVANAAAATWGVGWGVAVGLAAGAVCAVHSACRRAAAEEALRVGPACGGWARGDGRGADGSDARAALLAGAVPDAVGGRCA